ncbi:hypothetical protein NIES4071_27490 [Calothrix sp. NIES-4071]|nr:hypothetical protein NIES4071_27490 [Calothrix sp. NIES-4071]BAZ57071.1 hypothetical protein NIES4105_27430 [Calothrix sp. NIES-4105]
MSYFMLSFIAILHNLYSHSVRETIELINSAFFTNDLELLYIRGLRLLGYVVLLRSRLQILEYRGFGSC